MQVLRGIAISPGIALGPVVVLDHRGLRLPSRSIRTASVAAELERLDRGLNAARDEAGRDEAEARTRLGPQYADILDRGLDAARDEASLSSRTGSRPITPSWRCSRRTQPGWRG